MPKQDTIQPRRAIAKFAKHMELKLRKHDNKGGWDTCSEQYLIQQLLWEVLELQTALLTSDLKSIHQEAADVANFAMMISDNQPDMDFCKKVENDKARRNSRITHVYYDDEVKTP